MIGLETQVLSVTSVPKIAIVFKKIVNSNISKEAIEFTVRIRLKPSVACDFGVVHVTS